MTSVPTLFQALGGPTKVARFLGVGVTTASEMKRRRSIPVRYWRTLIAVCKAEGVEGVSYETLVNMHLADEAAQ